jgi:hypothetical protein
VVFAIIFSVFALGFFIFCVRPRRYTKLAPVDGFFVQVNREIKIFNALKMNLKKQNGQVVLYSKYLGHLHINPKARIDTTDPIEKLFYVYACVKLFSNSNDFFLRRQYYKNILYAFNFGVRHETPELTQTHIKKMKISKKKRMLFAVPQPILRYQHTRFVRRSTEIRFSHSYTLQNTPTATIKNYIGEIADRFVECFEISGAHKFVKTFRFNSVCETSYTPDTFFYTVRGVTTAVFVSMDKKVQFDIENGANFMLSTAVTNAKIFILTGDRGQIQQMILKIKSANGNIEYLLTPEQIAENLVIERTLLRARNARFVSGVSMKKCIDRVAKSVPSVYLPTLVYEIADETDISAFLSGIKIAQKIALSGVNINVIVTYSSKNTTANEFIATTVTKKVVGELVRMGVYAFFFDTTVAAREVVYFYSQMRNHPQIPPYSINDPADNLVLISRKPVSYAVTNLKSGEIKYKRLAKNEMIVDEFGREIPVGGDAICNNCAYIVPCLNSQKCTGRETITSISKKRLKTQANLQKKFQTATSA